MVSHIDGEEGPSIQYEKRMIFKFIHMVIVFGIIFYYTGDIFTDISGAEGDGNISNGDENIVVVNEDGNKGDDDGGESEEGEKEWTIEEIGVLVILLIASFSFMFYNDN